MSGESKRQRCVDVSKGQEQNLLLQSCQAGNSVVDAMLRVVGNSCREDGLRRFAMKYIWLVLLACCFMGGLFKSAMAEEPSQAFLDGLRERGYYDSALEYLKSLETSRMVPAGMRDVLGYETALTLVVASRA